MPPLCSRKGVPRRDSCLCYIWRLWWLSFPVEGQMASFAESSLEGRRGSRLQAPWVGSGLESLDWRHPQPGFLTLSSWQALLWSST